MTQGNAYAYIARTYSGEAAELIPLERGRITINWSANPLQYLLDEPHDASDTLGGTASEVNASSGHALPLSRRRRAEVRGHRDPLVDAARENRRGWRVGEYHASAAVQGNRICGCNNL